MEKAKAEIRVSAIIISNPKFDSVSVAVPGHNHFPIAMAAIQRGKHVYVVSMQKKPHAKRAE
jgi:hypothetical protein